MNYKPNDIVWTECYSTFDDEGKFYEGPARIMDNDCTNRYNKNWDYMVRIPYKVQGALVNGREWLIKKEWIKELMVTG